ncbi:MAG: 30S ribosome-binding factor RbfA [Peptococcaceae bacterium]|jgi:ribosome-binding factor A|nr:30S ribosome-binding factor RbfA [Peptococcaceae bacterium]MDH7524086.1 30S ribosome-binding factor RbfA [Peptococcaceae bacterium]
MSGHRLARIAEEVKKELSQMIREEIKDPRVKGLISITHVEITSDLRYAKVYVSMFANENESERSFKGLEKASGYLRSELAKRLQLRFTPELIFKPDNSIAYGSKINKIIAEMKSGKGENEPDV